MWRLEERLGAQGDQLQWKMCEQEFQKSTYDIFHVRDNEFVKHKGNMIKYIKCAALEATIHEEATKCFEDSPIETPTRVGFVQPANWLFVSTSAPWPCSRHF